MRTITEQRAQLDDLLVKYPNVVLDLTRPQFSASINDHLELVAWAERVLPLLQSYVRCVNDHTVIADGHTQEAVETLIVELTGR